LKPVVFLQGGYNLPINGNQSYTVLQLGGYHASGGLGLQLEGKKNMDFLFSASYRHTEVSTSYTDHFTQDTEKKLYSYTLMALRAGFVF
jgi:hypothetical protein